MAPFLCCLRWNLRPLNPVVYKVACPTCPLSVFGGLQIKTLANRLNAGGILLERTLDHIFVVIIQEMIYTIKIYCLKSSIGNRNQ